MFVTTMQIVGRAKLGWQAFADALLVIPKTLAANSGLPTLATYRMRFYLTRLFSKYMSCLPLDHHSNCDTNPHNLDSRG
jgi:chaperonin GroEL (HSP60 family)